jgi:hypothetical protein
MSKFASLKDVKKSAVQYKLPVEDLKKVNGGMTIIPVIVIYGVVNPGLS